MEAISEKRRRLSPAAAAAASDQDFLDQLPDTVIEEILLRLPFSSVFNFRCTSKRCRSLTTAPHFVQSFHRHHASSDDFPPPLLLLHSFKTRTYREFFVSPRLPEFKFLRLSLDFLPGVCVAGDEQRHNIAVVGASDDLFLCSNRASFQSEYFIVNPITRLWLALPLAPRLHKFILTGFVCDPASITEARNGGKLRFRVVRMPLFNESTTKLEIFSSENWRWNGYALPWTEGPATIWWRESAVACNGNLYWRFIKDGAKTVCLDPFDLHKKEIQIIQDPPNSFLGGRRREDNLGLCRGKLTLCRSSWSSEGFYEPPLEVKIWELKEDENGKSEWRLTQKVSFAAAECFRQPRAAVTGSWTTLGVHPGAGDMVYFACSETSKVICCNLKKMSLEVVGGEDLDSWFVNWGATLIFALPCWPTPLPSLPHI